jgi:hypothetical protein
MEMRFLLMPQIDMAPGLVMNVKASPRKRLKQSSRSYPRQLWHCIALQRAHIRQELAVRLGFVQLVDKQFHGFYRRQWI